MNGMMNVGLMNQGFGGPMSLGSPLLGMSAMPGFSGNCCGMDPYGLNGGLAQQAMLGQQLMQVEFLLGMLMGMMMGRQMAQALQQGGIPGLGQNFGGGNGAPGGAAGGPGASGNGSGNAGGPSGANGSGGSHEANGAGGAAPTSSNYSGPINVDKVVAALPSGYQKAARQHFPGILAECQKQGVTDKAQIAYILATTVHESGAGAHMEEFASGSAYEGRRDLGNTQSGDGVRFKGRGYVQITGRNNYTNWSKKLGLDLVGNPKLAENPATAARILVQGMKEGSFTGKKLSDYIGGGKQDFEGARRIVNGTNKAGTFADTARKILAAMN